MPLRNFVWRAQAPGARATVKACTNRISFEMFKEGKDNHPQRKMDLELLWLHFQNSTSIPLLLLWEYIVRNKNCWNFCSYNCVPSKCCRQESEHEMCLCTVSSEIWHIHTRGRFKFVLKLRWCYRKISWTSTLSLLETWMKTEVRKGFCRTCLKKRFRLCFWNVKNCKVTALHWIWAT